ncbi:MAG TPA: OFA family MFS transporter [Steroidobacteraceae bacterium]|nr:OFA family MFS transporter [Steroidobacteraceae bacterium]
MPNRWVIAIAGTVVMVTIGCLYSWALFTQPLLVAYHWDLRTTTWAYAIANFSVAAVGAVIGGFWQDQAGPRKVAMVGVALWGLGNMLAGLGTSSLGAPWLYATYGIMGGIGAGMAYITPVAMVTKWFPDRKGLAGGLVAAGFGLGAFIYNLVVPRLAGFHAAALHAGSFLAAKAAATAAGAQFDLRQLTAAQTFTAGDIGAVMQVFVVSGTVFLVVGLIATSLFRNPPPGYCVATPKALAGRTTVESYSPSQIIATPQFYLLWLQLFVNVIGGITIISNAVFILTDLTSVSAASVAPLFGLVSIFNALGRLFWGAVSDRIGCNRTFAALFVIQAVTLLLLTNVHDLTLALLATSVVLFCCGGGFGTMPSFNAGYFGTKYMGLNYALILTAWGFAALVGPTLVARAKDMTGSFAGILPLIALLLTGAVILPFLTKKPSRRGFTPRDSPESSRSGGGSLRLHPIFSAREFHSRCRAPFLWSAAALHRSARAASDARPSESGAPTR